MELKKLKRPIVMLNITERCQLRCRHCYNNSGVGCESNAEEFQRLVDKVNNVAGTINFTGGEPLLRPELPELLAYTASRGIDNIITTNGLLLDENWLGKAEGNLYMLKIGMMGATAETNDYIRGKGHFEVAMKALDLMRNYDVINCMKISLDKHNYFEMEQMVQLAVGKGVKQIVFGQLVGMGRAAKQLVGLFFGYDELRVVQEKIGRLHESYGSAVKIAPHCTLSGLCADAGEFYTVTAQGKVSPCLMREDLALGNLYTENAAEVFSRVDSSRGLIKAHSSWRDLEKRMEMRNYGSF